MDLMRNALWQYRRFWISSLFMVLASAVGVTGVVLTLGTALDLRWRSVQIDPPDRDRTVRFVLAEGTAAPAQIYEALRNIDGLAAVIMDDTFPIGPAGTAAGAMSMDLRRRDVWVPPVQAGRFLTPEDGDPGADPVIVIGSFLAAQWFPGEDAVGREVELQTDGSVRRFRVVGVVGVRGRFTVWDQQAFVPAPWDQRRSVTMFSVKALSPEQVAGVVDDVQAAIERQIAGARVSPLGDYQQVDNPDTVAAIAAGGLAILVVVVTALNSGNLAGFWVIRRRREIGIRQALGATRGMVVRMVLTEVVLLNLIGAALGVLLYLFLRRLLADELPLQLHAAHFVVGGAAGVLSGLVAAAVPARLAARLDPAQAMREE